MKAKKIIACALVANLTFGQLLSMKPEKATVKAKKKEEKKSKHKYFIKFHDKKFPVNKQILEQFETYITEKEFGGKAATKKPAILKTETSTVWDITSSIQILIGKHTKSTARTWALFTKLIDLLIEVASKKIDPYKISSPNTLFMLIKVADLLRNKQVMQICVPTLIKTIAGNLLRYSPVRTFSGSDGIPYAIVLLPGTDLFFSHSRDGTIKLWNINQTKSVQTFEEPTGFNFVPLPDTDLFFSYSYTYGPIKLWNINQSKPIRTFSMEPMGGIVLNVIPLPGTDLFLSYSRDRTIKLWNINQSKSVRTFEEPTEIVVKLVLLPGTDLFLSYSRDDTIKLWNINQTKSIRTFAEHTNEVSGIIPLPGTDLFLSCSRDGTIKLWNINQTKSVRTFVEHTKEVVNIIPLPGTDLFLSYSKDGTIKLWNINQKKAIRTFETGKVDHITLIPNTDQFIAEKYKGGAKLWNINYKRPRHAYPSMVTHAILLSNNQQFLSSSPDGNIELWNINPPDGNIELWNINPFANLTFEQVKLCFSIFTSEGRVPVEKGSPDYQAFKSLPRFLQEAVKKVNQ